MQTPTLGSFRRVKSSRLLSAAVIGGAMLVIAGSVGVADNNVTYNGCENIGTGLIRLLTNTNLSAPYNACLTADVITARRLPAALTEVPVSWNQQGPPGQNGTNGANGTNGESVVSTPVALNDPNCPAGGSRFAVGNVTTYACNGMAGQSGAAGTSVSSAALSVGDPNCPNGGAAFTSASGTAYACNGATGPKGDPGPAGSLTSPSGIYTVTVTEAGIVLHGPGGEVVLGPAGVSVVGSVVRLNGGSCPVATSGSDVVQDKVLSFDVTVLAPC